MRGSFSVTSNVPEPKYWIWVAQANTSPDGVTVLALQVGLLAASAGTTRITPVLRVAPVSVFEVRSVFMESALVPASWETKHPQHSFISWLVSKT
jgi:hypothetical protein